MDLLISSLALVEMSNGGMMADPSALSLHTTKVARLQV
ncbi:hypothetical protein QF025_002725 [Paraburkholderia graminis]|uniref:Uncharacterized protein n=1 Tax=Paraburkholderia graminis TaxID=60548 RepID=A0ABD5CHI3_9BURK|nr:hypothetical protein [Paraburkholderia graminis]